MSHIPHFLNPSNPSAREAYRQPIGPIARVLAWYARQLGIPLPDLIDRRVSTRTGPDVRRRYVAAWLCRHATGRAWERIALRMQFDRSTIAYADLTVRKLRERDPEFRAYTDALLAGARAMLRSRP